MKLNGMGYALTASMLLGGCAKEEAQSAVTSNTPAPTADTPVSMASASSPTGPLVKVYKDPNCGCCIKWVDHMKENGFTVETVDMPDLSMIKQKYMVGDALRSCHTSVIGDYAVEGHVPADVIKKMLEEKPAIAGLAVPGMPTGSPGMEGAPKERYDILTFDRAGKTTVYAQR